MHDRISEQRLATVVVDPEPADFADLLRAHALLRPEAFWCIFTSGRAALRHLPRCVGGLQTHRRLYLVNVNLPDMSGLDLARMLPDHAGRGTVVLVGDVYREEEELAARQCGVPLYLCKPVGSAWGGLLEPPLGLRALQGKAAHGSLEPHPSL